MLKSIKKNQIPLLSIIIGFRDWGLDRLDATIRAHRAHAPSDCEIEVIVSDYGSKEEKEVRRVAHSAGARVARSARVGPWNRSAALNAGIAVASGQFLITTDADIIFSPEVYSRAIDMLTMNPHALYLIQCRDLPDTCGSAQILARINGEGALDFGDLEQVSSIRPRWGMGGFAAFSKAAFVVLNGYEERMRIWGKEDNDFAKRFRRAGMPVRWLAGDKTRIYHIWHASSQVATSQTEEGTAALAENSRILKEDLTIVRNRSRIVGHRRHPLVSVVIPTYKRAKQLEAALRSCQKQTFENFEVVVVENGNSQEAEEVVNRIQDCRFRYFYSKKPGAAAARNLGTMVSKGRFIAIHDDDDLMVSSRLEDHLAALTAGYHGTYSGWIDFDDKTQKIISRNPGKEFSFEAILFGGKVLLHPSVLIEKKILKAFPYDETRMAGIDYALFLRLAWHGLKLSHTGSYGILRRMHSSNMTAMASDVQKESADMMKKVMLDELGQEAQKKAREKGRTARERVCSNEKKIIAEFLGEPAGINEGATNDLDSILKKLGKNWMQDAAIRTVLEESSRINIGSKPKSCREKYFISRARTLAVSLGRSIEFCQR